MKTSIGKLSTVGGMSALLLAFGASNLATAESEEAGREIHVKGATQLLFMGRDYGGNSFGDSTSASITLDVSTRLTDAAMVKGQYLLVEEFQESGCDRAAYWLSNDDTSLLNELYLKMDLRNIGFEKTEIQLGRQMANYDFFGAYKVRHKAQSFEGAILKTKLSQSMSLDIGHIERYSSWPCRDGGPSSLNSEFMDLSQRLGFGGGDKGVQFASSTWEAKEGLKLTAYDYYASSYYNNAGMKGEYTLVDSQESGNWKVSGHLIQQDGMSDGRMATHDARATELALAYTKDALSLNTGWTHIANASNLAVPFRTSFVIDATLLWYTNQFEAGTDSLHAKVVWKKGDWTLVGVLVGAEHADRREEQEVDLVVKRSFENGFWAAFKGGYGHRSFEEATPSQHARDLRLFVGYDF